MTINRGYYGNLAFRSLGVGKSDNEGGKATHPYSLIPKILRLPCIMRSRFNVFSCLFHFPILCLAYFTGLCLSGLAVEVFGTIVFSLSLHLEILP